MSKAFFGLPEEVKFCKKCVISNQRPSSTVEFRSTSSEKKEVIGFDEEGVCSACRYHSEKEVGIDWKQREEVLLKLLEKYRRNDGRYDCIVPGSGGKDSAYTSHILKYKYGMNPLTVTWAPHLYTEIGWQNFTNWMHEGGLDNMLYTPNGVVHRLLTKKAFHNLLHPFQPFIIGQRIIGPSLAAKFDVPLVFYGENQAEYGNNVDDNEIPTMDTKFFEVADINELVLGGEKIKDLINNHNFGLGDFSPYIPVDKKILEEKKIAVHYLGYYLKWDPQECYYYAIENTGFKANSERTEGSYSKYSSIDDKIDPFHYYTTLIKFGIGRATYDAAQEERNGKIERDEAIALVKRFDREFPQKYFNEFLNYIDTSEEEFWTTIDKFRSPHLWKKNGENWELLHKVEDYF